MGPEIPFVVFPKKMTLDKNDSVKGRLITP